MPELRTERLLLRRWRESDLEPWAAMNADPAVREHLGPVLTREQSNASVARFEAAFEARGFGWWAVETAATGEFLGFTGLDPVDDGLPFAGVEIGWRLARTAWGHGYATEAARAALAFGFETLGLAEILAVTTAANHRSQAVMRRLGMATDPADDFDDPDAPPGPLRRGVLYRISRASWTGSPAPGR
ncbi:GNAT family N-acetyltransferase [Streptacidiphilus sp. PB12-B1b]|uniref:GNAT family N-acetyltransferase n=1 Tax=Streptacidiphilus sp. PB12-B1b TaxID=2705012 RepID=UPI0015FBCF39|nr:GNAT family N-acetyltransferase [Streptacidiphilus sp. PB12-B1b]QMU77416.1 GNAT family N-acetyltransferase [Streptacidiphilus sp. PB12-B1b]